MAICRQSVVASYTGSSGGLGRRLYFWRERNGAEVQKLKPTSLRLPDPQDQRAHDSTDDVFRQRRRNIAVGKSSLGEHLSTADGVIETDTIESEMPDFFRRAGGAAHDLDGAGRGSELTERNYVSKDLP